MTTFDFIPVLSMGQHDTPQEGACVMEMVSFLSADEWTDFPKCSNRVISRIAQIINDELRERDRHLILSQFDRLFNTNDVSAKEMKQALMPYAKNLVENYDFALPETREDALYYIKGVSPVDVIEMVAMDAYYRHDMGEYLVSILSDVLDIYDKISGRKSVEKQDITKLAELPSQVKV